ncbi:MAG: TfoX/Sxy family protein [Dehalococcoidia bacterium]
MAFDHGLALRVRALTAGEGAVEQHLFGGLGFFDRGHLFAGVIGTELVVRVGVLAYPEAQSLPGARPFDYPGKPMRGWVYVAAAAVASDADLRAWLARGLAFTATLPAKGARPRA